MIPERTISRLSLYRRLLLELLNEGAENVVSRELARLAGVTAPQVRRDIMTIGGHAGHPARGYDVARLVQDLSAFLDAAEAQGMALVGVGNLGHAILGYFAGRTPKLQIRAAFDVNPAKINSVIHGCRCHPVDALPEVVQREGILVGIITVPAPSAQTVAGLLCRGGIRGIVNFAPVRLMTPPHVFVEDIDMSLTLEKVAYFARQPLAQSQAAGDNGPAPTARALPPEIST